MKVKLLDWQGWAYGTDRNADSAWFAGHYYRIYWVKHGYSLWYPHQPIDFEDYPVPYYDTMDEAKAAAQLHCENSVLEMVMENDE